MKHLVLNERDLKALRIFKIVAQAGGFSAAEKMLNMTTATISRYIKDVEDRLGVSLCARGPQGFTLTKAGEAALEYIQYALDAVGNIIPAINATQSVLSGELRIGVLDKIIENPDCQLRRALSILADEAPNVEVSLETLTKSAVFNSVEVYRYHLIIDAILNKSPSLRYEYLFNEVQKIYFYPIKNKFHDDLPLVNRPIQNLLKNIIEQYGYKKGPTACGLQSVAFLILTGNYKGMLPVHYAKHLSVDFDLEVIPESPEYRIPFYAVTNPARPLPLCAERFIQILKECHQ